MAAMGTPAADIDAMKNRRRTTTKTKRPSAPKVSRRRMPSGTNASTEIALLKRERDEAIEQQRATSEVLRAISNSPTDTASTLSAISESVARLLEVTDAEIMSVEGNALRSVAKHGSASQWPMGTRQLMSRDWVTGRAVIDRTIVHVADLQASERDFPQGAAYARQFGHRTILAVPLLREGSAIGAFLIRRMAVKPFTDKQIALVQNFAAQAVIAIENTRLLNELRQRTDDLTESLEQQTATSEVLSVISSSPGELEPVFRAMLENAAQICEAKFGVMFRFDDDVSYVVATLNLPLAVDEFFQQRGRVKPTPGSDLDSLWKSKQVVHTLDMSTSPTPSRIAKLAGVRTQLAVPMLLNNKLIGAINLHRQEVRPFTEKQIELVQNFAAQAVIAIENTRLLNELRQRTDDLSEALEQQTATSEVLGVISKSPGELEPVFNAMLENAVRICGARFGTLFRFDGDKFHTSAYVGAPQAYIDFQNKRGPFVPPPGAPLAQLLETKNVVRTLDMSAHHTPVAEFVEFAGTKSHIAVPMLRDNALVGAIVIYNQEVQPFTDKQVELVQNFAAQAVIAIENTRLLNELRESLQQQTATADVLKVISSSPGDLQPVFQSMLENAVRLCEAKFGMLFLYDEREREFRAAATWNLPTAYAEESWEKFDSIRSANSHGPCSYHEAARSRC